MLQPRPGKRIAEMLKSVHLVGEDEDDDLYGGFEDYNPALDTGVGANLG